MSAPPALEIIVLCGALGSGKTTLLTQFLSSRDLHDTAVIVNEAGEIGLDAAIVQAASPQDPVLLLDNGCVCCSLRGSLVQTLLDLLHRPRPAELPALSRVVIETSGLSRPGPLLAGLRDRELLPLRPALRVVCTLDATRPDSGDLESDHLAQWAAAHRIVITRSDLPGALPLATARDVARGINPLATVIALADPEQRAQQALGADPVLPSSALAAASLPSEDDAMPARAHPASRGLLTEPGPAHPRIRVMQGEPAAGLRWEAFTAWVDDLCGLLGDRLLRFKAVLRPEDCPEALMLQGVGSTFSAPARAGAVFAQMGEQPSIIVIARDVDVDEVARELPDAPVTLKATRSRRAVFA